MTLLRAGFSAAGHHHSLGGTFFFGFPIIIRRAEEQKIKSILYFFLFSPKTQIYRGPREAGFFCFGFFFCLFLFLVLWGALVRKRINGRGDTSEGAQWRETVH